MWIYIRKRLIHLLIKLGLSDLNKDVVATSKKLKKLGHLINKGIGNIKDLQEASMEYVSAKSQARILEELINKNIFSEEELEIIKRARNNSSKHHPKS